MSCRSSVEDAAAQLEQLGWDGPYESAPDKLSGESSWRASRPGTHPNEVASSTLDGLIASVEAKEAALAESEAEVTPVE